MVHMAKACAECTQNCHLMHMKHKNPSPVATTFFKVMIGDDYSKVLFLPPRFAHGVQNMVGKATWLEDASGEKWTVKFKKVDGLLAFEDGWNKFSLAHGLRVGDFLVFHYIMDSHFVVLMYGQSGSPEIRHFGFTPHQTKETKKKSKLATDDRSPSNANKTNGRHCSYESSSQSEASLYGLNESPEIRNSIGTRQKKKGTKKKGNDTRNGPSVSVKETVQKSKPFMDPDNMVTETPTMKQSHVVDSYNGDAEDENDVSIPKIVPDESGGGRKDQVKVGGGEPGGGDGGPGGGGDETQVTESSKAIETQLEESVKTPKQSNVTPSEATCNIKKRLRSADFPFKQAKMVKKESVCASENVTLRSRKLVIGSPSPSTGAFSKPIAKLLEETKKEPTMNHGTHVARAKMVKKEPVSASETETSGSRLRDCPLASTGGFTKPVAKQMDTNKKELPKNHDAGFELKGNKIGCNNSRREENDDILATVKPEPIDYDEAIPRGATNPSFSAVMSSCKYLELPKWVKLKSKVILLRNDADLWPVLYEEKLGLKALTKNWEVFACEKGIKEGDKCEFTLESEPNSRTTCCVFTVDVTRE